MIDTMRPPDLLLNRPGDLKTKAWSYYPPVLPEGVQTSFPVKARVTYDYHTTGTISIPAYSKSYYRIPENSGKLDLTPTVDNTNAPIQISLRKGTAVVVDDRSTGDEYATFIIDFVNVGDGHLQ